MIKHYNNVYVSRNYVTRQELSDRYFPYLEYPRERAELKNSRKWSEGWFCEFFNNGLALDIITIRTPAQYDIVNAYRLKNNLPTDQHTEFYKKYSIDLASDKEYFHPANISEHVRELIDIAARFKETAVDMTSWQFYVADNAVEYGISFKRSITADDVRILEEISKDLQSCKLM